MTILWLFHLTSNVQCPTSNGAVRALPLDVGRWILQRLIARQIDHAWNPRKLRLLFHSGLQQQPDLAGALGIGFGICSLAQRGSIP